MANPTGVLMILVFVSGLLTLTGQYSPLAVNILSLFSEGGTLSSSLGSIIVATVPIVIVGVGFFSGSTAFASVAAVIFVPLLTIPFDLFTDSLMPLPVRLFIGGFYVVLIGMAMIGLLRGDT